MAESAYTRGPWKVESTDTTFNVVSHDGIKVVSTSWHQRLRKPYPLKAEAFANATMCAAAPDLVEALQWAMRQLGSPSRRIKGQNEAYCDGYDAARAALSRALGQEG